MDWKILDTGYASAEKNMEIDRALLRDLKTLEHAILRFYEWEGKCISYGYFLNPYHYLKREVIEDQGVQLVRRPTGGGVVSHFNDFTFSFLIPVHHCWYSANTVENYQTVNAFVAKCLQQVLGIKESLALFCSHAEHSSPDAQFCAATPTIYDVMYQGRKIAGGAQRRTRNGFLHQGTIFLKSCESLAPYSTNSISSTFTGTWDLEKRRKCIRDAFSGCLL